MRDLLDITFDYDFDSDLYMLSSDPDAKNWEVIIHCEDGTQYMPSIETFSPYPGCPTHEDKTAWSVDYFKPLQIEVQRQGHKAVRFPHPDVP